MKQNRRKFNPEFKTKVVLEALSERLTLTELAQKYELHPNQITLWKREFLDRASEVFSKSDKAQKAEQDSKQETEELYKTIGQLKVEVDWLKKKTSVVKTLSERRSMIEKEHPKISLNRQCELLSIHRSGCIISHGEARS